jgi:hypothetical protein
VVHFDDFVNAPATLGQDHDAIGEVQSLIDIVSHQNNSCSGSLSDVDQQILHQQTGQSVERREGFIEKQYPWVTRKTPSESSSLRHSPRDLTWNVLFESGQSDTGKKVKNLLVASFSSGADRNIVFQTEPRQQSRLLENKTATSIDALDRQTVNCHRSFAGAIEPSDQSQKS